MSWWEINAVTTGVALSRALDMFTSWKEELLCDRTATAKLNNSPYNSGPQSIACLLYMSVHAYIYTYTHTQVHRFRKWLGQLTCAVMVDRCTLTPPIHDTPAMHTAAYQLHHKGQCTHNGLVHGWLPTILYIHWWSIVKHCSTWTTNALWILQTETTHPTTHTSPTDKLRTAVWQWCARITSMNEAIGTRVTIATLRMDSILKWPKAIAAQQVFWVEKLVGRHKLEHTYYLAWTL